MHLQIISVQQGASQKGGISLSTDLSSTGSKTVFFFPQSCSYFCMGTQILLSVFWSITANHIPDECNTFRTALR